MGKGGEYSSSHVGSCGARRSRRIIRHSTCRGKCLAPSPPHTPLHTHHYTPPPPSHDHLLTPQQKRKLRASCWQRQHTYARVSGQDSSGAVITPAHVQVSWLPSRRPSRRPDPDVQLAPLKFRMQLKATSLLVPSSSRVMLRGTAHPSR